MWRLDRHEGGRGWFAEFSQSEGDVGTAPPSDITALKLEDVAGLPIHGGWVGQLAVIEAPGDFD